MTTANSNAGNRGTHAVAGTIRGRGLDALFEGTTAPSSVRSDIDADLAVLLDDEMLAAETGRSTAAAEQSILDSAPQPSSGSTSTTPNVYSESVRSEPIDVPPSAAEARPKGSTGGTRASTTESQPTRQLPTTKRFGAIIMDESSAVPEEAEPADTLVPLMPGERAVPPGPGVVTIDTAPIVTVERTDDQKTIVISRLDQVLEKNWQRAFHQPD